MTDRLKAYPVVFRYAELVEGRGFVARVVARGSALMTHDDDGEWWMYGVEPGGLAEGGESFDEARLQFRESFRMMLRELGAEPADSAEAAFSRFKDTLERFFHQTNPTMAKRWHRAVQEVRAAQNDALDEPIGELPRVRAEEHEPEVAIDVQRITQPDESSPFLEWSFPDLELADAPGLAA